jgi:hypothetical protein
VEALRKFIWAEIKEGDPFYQAALKFSQRNNPYCELVSFVMNIENFWNYTTAGAINFFISSFRFSGT